MKVTLTSPAEGKQPGETVDVDESRAKWLIAEGYAVGDKDVDGITMTAADPKDDPTLAENREAPGEPVKEPKPKAAPRPAKAEPKTSAAKTD